MKRFVFRLFAFTVIPGGGRLLERDVYRIYSFKYRPRLSAAYESKNIKERRPRISAALIHNNAALNRSTVRQNCSRSQTKKQLQYISILNQPRKFILQYYSVFKFKVSIFQCSPIQLSLQCATKRRRQK